MRPLHARRPRHTTLAILAATALLPPATAQAATTATGTQALTAAIDATLAATFPSAYAFANFVPGTTTTSTAQTLNVKSNASWGVRITSENAKLRPHDGAGYVGAGTALTNSLEWRLSEVSGADPAGSFAAVPTSAGDVTTGRAKTTDSGNDVKILYRQATSFGDAVLSGGDNYRVVVTYDALQGI